MLINEVISEGYFSDLILTVQDLLTKVAAKGIEDIPTEEFRSLLAKQGYVTTTDELIAAIDKSGHASSVNRDMIKPKNQLPAEISTGDDEAAADTVSDLAQGAAATAMNTEIA
jgi:hypothetical protein